MEFLIYKAKNNADCEDTDWPEEATDTYQAKQFFIKVT
jgi:hypothetical protein